MAAFSFLQPRNIDSVDGGGAYTRNLIAALRDLGHDVDLRPGTQQPPGRIAVIDGLDLPIFDPAGVSSAVGLIHHFAALPGGSLVPHMRRVVATSDATAARLTTEYGVPDDRIAAIPPGVPEVGRSSGSGGPHCEILSIGALVPRKGHAVLITALTKLFDLNWRLTIVGDDARDPATASALQAMASQTGGRITLAGALDDAALEPLWARADLFALATTWEGYAAPVAEALRRGVPVAVTAGGAAAALVTPQSGVICDVNDATQLSKSLRRLIFDTALRASITAGAWRAGQSLPTWRQQAARFADAAAA